MKLSFAGVRARHISVALAVVSIALLGCARKLQIEVPAGFHGHVHITCTSLTSDRTRMLLVRANELTVATCPERQSDAVVIREDSKTPLETTVMWTVTGDGLVREIQFEVK